MVSKSGCLGWLKKRTNLEKTLLSLSSILLLTLLLVILIGATYHGNKDNSLEDETSCWSKECIQTAGEALKSLEPEADACSNFYDYACGKYGQEPGQTVSVARQSTDSVYFSLKRLMESQRRFDIQGLDDVRSFYNSCVRFGSYRQALKKTGESLLEVMKEVGVGIWPIVDPYYDTEAFSLERTLASLILLDVPVVFHMEVVPDQKIPGSDLIKISPGRPHETGRTQSEIRADVLLKSSVLTSLLLIGSASASAETEVADILNVDSHLAAIEQDFNATCNVITLAPQEVTSELKRLMPEINWDLILTEFRDKTKLFRPFAVELHCKQKIRDYFEYLNKDITIRTSSNYLSWRLFSKFVEHVVPTFEKSQFGMGEPVARWRVCLELMERFSSPILADLLSREIVPKDVQEEVERMSNASLSAAELLVSRAGWLSDGQKSRIAEKVSRIRTRYPYKRPANNGDAAQIVIPKVDVANFTRVVILQQREWVIQRFKRLEVESSVQAGSWRSLLTGVDNFPSSDLTAYVYFDKIRTPYVRLQGSQWMNYGGFGMFIAREISRVLISLNVGVGHEEKDMVWKVWSQNTNSSTCLLRTLGSSLTASLRMISSRAKTKLLQSIFLDHSALEIAYEAAKSTAVSSKSLPGLDFSDEKFFFLSYAQTTCEADFQPQKIEQFPTRERLESTVRNFKSFNEVFSCSSLSTCQIWA